jgi:lipoprotein-releasing system permease protein
MKNFSYFIAQRISSREGSAFYALIVRTAIGCIALGMATIILSDIIFNGFKHTIQEKIFSFSGHIQLAKYAQDNSFEVAPVPITADVYKAAKQMPEIQHIQVCSYKAGLLKTDQEVMGVVFKGVGSDFDTTRFYKNLVEGKGLELNDSSYSKGILISKRMANRLQLSVGDKAVMYFVQDPPKYRPIEILGFYDTGIEDFDDLFLIGDHRMVQKLNNWEDSLVGGFEVFVNDFSKLDDTYQLLLAQKDYFLDAEMVTYKYRHLFDWFIMINQHVNAILAIILAVASFNVVSIVLILIIERTQMIGTLKALGATNGQLQRLFLYKGFQIMVQGLALGNAFAISIGLLQKHFRLIPLDAENYYMDAVPILRGKTS